MGAATIGWSTGMLVGKALLLLAMVPRGERALTAVGVMAVWPAPPLIFLLAITALVVLLPNWVLYMLPAGLAWLRDCK